MSTFEIASIPSQKGRLAIVTGANVGLGYETALALAKKDFEVVLACRNLHKAEKAKANIREIYPEAKVECLEIDLSKLKSVRLFAELFKSKYNQLDLLINNAGIMMTPYKRTEDGFENQLGSNYLGHFLLTGLLLPYLEKTPGSRVVSLSSNAHRWGTIRLDDLHFEQGYNPRAAYGQSKLACLMFSYELDRKLRQHQYQIKSVAAHPGITLTNLINHFNPVTKFIANILSPLFFHSIKSGALPVLRAALDPDIKGGEYFGPGGFREYKGPPVKVDSNRKSKDIQTAKRLWDLSEESTGIIFFK